jgi:class 3 adenylate cyclase/putative methionine-R-sulfoxide reductase with GAF domain
MRTDPSYVNGDPLPVSGVDIGGVRTLVVVPMIKDADLVGAIAIYRKEVHPFAEKQIELLSNFAAQAVIAIENARLLNELRGSLEQQTATSDVLRIVAGSLGELDAVFKTMLKNARHICDAKFGILMLREAEGFRSVAIDGAPDAYTAAMRENPYIPPRPGSGLVVLVEAKKPVQIADVQAEPGYAGNRLTTLAGARTLLIVPLLKDDAVLGAINIYRQEVRSFTEQQIALLQNFAAQAVIAIENARLLNELRQRTADLSESLEQQTATSEILRVISSSPSELEPVFQTILEKAVRICDANFGTLFMVEGDKYRTAAGHNMPPAFLEQRRQAPMLSMLGDTALGRVAKTKLPVQIPDAAEDPAYRADPQRRSFISQAGARTLVCVPMLKQEALVGAIGIYRKEVRPFNDKQIALVQNFADQAVIAIENARLLNELRERTHELEARSQEIAKLNLQLEARVADQVGEIERMGRLRRFLPPQVADLIVASGTEKQLESHRREITALFCDLRGFTGFSESSDPEDVMTLLRQYHAAIGEIIIKYSGTLERYAGDGVMVVFNDPVPVDNPALQAVRMALDMRAALGTLIEKWRRLGHELGFGIGIAHGYATLGTIGFEGRFDYAAIGTVSNVASRLCDEAKPGQILISPRVLMAVEDAVTVAPVGDFALKGISRPLAAYNVVEAK